MPGLDERGDFLYQYTARLDIILPGHENGLTLTPYPHPASSGDDLMFKEILNGSFRQALTSQLRRYDTEDTIRDRMQAGDLRPLGLIPDAPSGDWSRLKESIFQPYYLPWRKGSCEQICVSEITLGGIVLEAVDISSFEVPTTSHIGYSLFQDNAKAGIIFWYDGEFHFYDFIAKTYTFLYNSSVVPDKTYLFDKTLACMDASGQAHIISYTGISSLGVKGYPMVINNTYAVIQGSGGTTVTDLTGKIILANEDARPNYYTRFGTQNYFREQGLNNWGTGATTVAQFKSGVISILNKESGYTHSSLWTHIKRDWAKMIVAKCGDAALHPYYTPRFPCTDIIVDPLSGYLYYTRDWKDFVDTGIKISVPMFKLHRMRSIRRIGYHDIDIKYNGDRYNPSNGATITMNIQLMSY
jgi:hypothetical protein